MPCSAFVARLGRPCRARALRGDYYCWFHHPEKRPLMLQAARRGGWNAGSAKARKRLAETGRFNRTVERIMDEWFDKRHREAHVLA